MIQIKFKNLEKSELAREAVIERFGPLLDKFEDLKKSKVVVTLGMENSLKQPGPDVFSVKLHVSQGRYNGVIFEKSNANMYAAVAQVVDHALEILNRFGDRTRVKQRKQARDLTKKMKDIPYSEEQRIG